ncbi:structural maintenance of chromosomes protein 1B [Lampris incognitus]|uniref:structural maintenance of chromosomes protein 1B n=1 Tax=Lampris incognitus TaxID=2546036 RepID=UPI0024B49670|nr:structural maintenance of chromosomes protein 1B [Lampris incognitus]
MGYLEQIEVENFKSWRGKQVIGPFMRFNCIIGTNGSGKFCNSGAVSTGKSNIMDALSFVMGERCSSLRVMHSRDLIYGAHIGNPVSDTASVSMHYRRDDGTALIFCRRISGDSSEYCVNGIHVTLAKYTQELQEIGIVTKTRNCLIFQGGVESIAMMNPKKRTKMFEHISQSGEYAQDYEKKKEALLKAKENTHFLFNKKKTANAERKRVSQERVEAQKYQALVEELNQSRLQLYLFQLYYNEEGIKSLIVTLEEKRQTVAMNKGRLENWEQAVKTHKKMHGRFTRELQQIENEIRTQEQTLCLRRPQYIKAKVNTSHHVKKAEEVRSALQKGLKQRATIEAELADGKHELAKLERVWLSYERQLQQEGALEGRDIQLEEDQLIQYKELNEMARRQVGVLNQQAEKLHWEVKADYEKIYFDQGRKKELEACIKNIQNQQEDLTHRVEKLEEYTSKCKVSLDEYRNQEVSLCEQLERGRLRTEEINQELHQVEEELGNARLDNQESRRYQQRKDVLENLRRLYPKEVYGRLVDLCSPIHKQYQLAVAKVFGRYMNAIVVTSEKVARDCIHIIKEERAEPETFLPINYLNVSPLNERLREVQGAKMLVDVVQFSSSMAASHLRKVVQFVCGNTLVCETIKEARSIAFDKSIRIKTVALDGTLFFKSGAISGGASDLRTKARCWDNKDMKRLKERKDQLTAELRDLMKLRRKEAELKQIQAQAHGSQTRLKYSNADLDNLRKKSIPNCEGEISCMKSELAHLELQIKIQQDNVEVKDAKLKETKEQIEQVKDEVFGDFCAQIGVASIKEYKKGHLQKQTELDRKRLEFERQSVHLSVQLEYEEDRLEQHKKRLDKLQETISKEERDTTEQKKEEEKLLALVEESQTKVLELKNHLLAKKSQVADSKATLDQKICTLQETNSELVKLQRAMISMEVALEQKQLTKHNLLLACKIQCLPLILLSGNLEEISEVKLDSESESTATTMDIYEREARLLIDYSGLEIQLKCLQTEEEEEAQKEKMREEITSIEGVLQRTVTPNLKALEKMREVKDKFCNVVEAFNASTREARMCSFEFEQVKSQRYRLFSECFEPVSIVIDQIYKRMCQNTSAQAILSVENPDEPYLGSINYSCVAPGKRFMAMENLSGGEKTIAALALVFAIHSFRPAPFFILDEVDAALDNSNIGKVTNFIREESRKNMQIIVISLKEEFYSRADALLGVYPEVNNITIT